MKEELVSLIGALRGIPYSGGRRRYPEALKARVVQYYRARQAAGALSREVAAELGLSSAQLSDWSRRSPEGGFEPVQLVDDRALEEGGGTEAAGERVDVPRPIRPERERVLPASAPPLVLTSPGGWRIEGLDLASLAHLLEQLS